MKTLSKILPFVKNSIQTFSQIASNLAEAIRNLPPDELDEIDRDLHLNYFFIDFNNEKNEEEIMSAYSYFYHTLGRFPGNTDLVIIPKPGTPAFIKTNKIISPNQLYEKFRGTDTKGLVSVQALAALNIHLGGDTKLSRKTMTEFLHNMSMQALNRENDSILLDFEKIIDLVPNIIVLLRQQNKKSSQINDLNEIEVALRKK